MTKCKIRVFYKAMVSLVRVRTPVEFRAVKTIEENTFRFEKYWTIKVSLMISLMLSSLTLCPYKDLFYHKANLLWRGKGFYTFIKHILHLHTVDFAGLSDSLLSKQNYSCKYNIWSTEKELFYFLYSETFVHTLPINIELNSIFKLPHSLPWLFLFVKFVFAAEQLQ